MMGTNSFRHQPVDTKIRVQDFEKTLLTPSSMSLHLQRRKERVMQGEQKSAA
jgi:hypothetical protein